MKKLIYLSILAISTMSVSATYAQDNHKKKEMEIPGERKRIEDEKKFQLAKKQLKDKYTKLDYLLEKETLQDYFEKIGEHLFEPELMLPDLRSFAFSIAFYLDNSYAELKTQERLAEIELYLTELTKLSNSVSQELSAVLLNLRGEIRIWKNVYKNIRNITAENYLQMREQLLKLLQDDEQIYKGIEAA